MAMFVILSVFSGLKEFSLSFTNDFDPDLKVTNSVGKYISINPNQEAEIKKIKGIVTQSKIIEERVLFLFDSKEIVTTLKGVDANYKKVNVVFDTLYQGNWLKQNTSQVVVGYGITQKLSLGLFDYYKKFEVFVPRPGKGAIETPQDAFNSIGLDPIGIYAINNEDLDSKYVFSDLTLAQELLELKPNQFSALELKTLPNADENQIKNKVQNVLKNKVSIKNRTQQNDSLNRMLNTENIAIYLIFTLVIIISLFTLFGALIMMILDKKSNLKTLLNLGVEIKNLKKIFIYQGILVCVIGGIVGLLLGSIIVVIQQQFQLIMITPMMPYPVVFSFQNIAIVFFTIVTLGCLASWIASASLKEKLLE